MSRIRARPLGVKHMTGTGSLAQAFVRKVESPGRVGEKGRHHWAGHLVSAGAAP